MTGYQPTDGDIKAIVKWLEEHDPENANEEIARQLLVEIKLGVRAIGLEDPDALDEFYTEFKNNRPTASP